MPARNAAYMRPVLACRPESIQGYRYTSSKQDVLQFTQLHRSSIFHTGLILESGGPSSSSRSSKVINLCANRKRICNFLLVILCKFGAFRTVFEIFTHKAIEENSFFRTPPLFEVPFAGTRQNFWLKHYSIKTEGRQERIQGFGLRGRDGDGMASLCASL